MKRKLSLLLVFVLLLSCFAGCGGEGEEPPAGTVGESATPVDLVKTSTLVYNGVSPRYDNVVLYKSGSLVGVLSNDGTVRISAQYTGMTPFNEDYVAFQNTAKQETGVMNLNGEVIVSGFYNNIHYLGADYVLLETPVDCEETHPKVSGMDTTTGQYYYFDYSVFSLSQKKEISCPALDAVMNLDAVMLYARSCYATEENLMLSTYNPDTTDWGGYVYYWESEKTSTGQDFYYDNWYDDGCAEIDGQLYNAKGEPIEQCSHGENLIVEERDGYYGVVDVSGAEIIPFQYSEIEEYTADIYAVRMNKSWGFIDKTGKVLMHPTINDDYEDSNRYFRTADTKKPCLYNPYDGTKTVYEYLKDLDNDKGTYSAYNGTGRGIVTFEKALTEFVYDENGNSIDVSKDGKVYVAQKGSTYDVYVWE